MNIYTKRVLAAYLASATISITSGVSEAALPRPEAFPIRLVSDILDDVENEEMDAEKKVRAVLAIAGDKRVDVRIRVCDLLAGELEQLPLESSEKIIEKLAADSDPLVRRQLEHAMFAAIDHATVLNRTRMITHWALSDSLEIRRVLTRVLQEDFFCLGASAIAGHLADDADVNVRSAVVKVIRARMHENPVSYTQVLKKLINDTDHSVSEPAQHVYHQVTVHASGQTETLNV